MPVLFDAEAIDAAFSLPDIDGRFPPDFADYLNELGARRPMVVLAFAPKAAGTFLRSAVVTAANGALVRGVHAQGGRDASFYLPTFLLYLAGGFPARTLVTHVHMQALPANIHVMEALGMRPAIMLRSIPDMLASYADMLDQDPLSPDNWLNVRLDAGYGALTPEAKGDFLIDMVGPWYASYFAGWMDYAQRDPGRVCVLEYDAFLADPAATLERILSHSGLMVDAARCRAALDAVWEDRASFRYNRGVSGRGLVRFTPAQIGRLRRLIGYYPNLALLADRLVPPATGIASGRAA